MQTIIRSIDRIITAEDIIPLLSKYGMLSKLAYEDIIDRAIAKIKCSPEEIAIASKLWQHQHGKSEISVENIASAIRKLKIEKFKQQTWVDRIPIYFNHRKKQLDRVTYSIVKTKQKEVAREIHFRLIEEEQTLAQLREELTQEGSKNSLIEVVEALGLVELGTLPSAIASQLSTMKVGNISLPITIENDWVILRLDRYVSAQCDRAMEKRLIDELFDRWMERQLTQQKYHLADINSLK